MIANKRDHLVQVAMELFNRHGFHATGIDAILAESGVAKMTLYKHFKSKEDLIIASLRRKDEVWRMWFVSAVERLAKRPADRLLAIFDAIEEWCHGPGFCGCTFLKATSEYANLDDPIHRVAIEHQQMLNSYICALAAEAGAADADTLANQLCLLMGGAIVTVQIGGNSDAVKQARAAGEILVKHAVAQSVRT